jgi:hypothetical protein
MVWLKQLQEPATPATPTFFGSCNSVAFSPFQTDKSRKKKPCSTACFELSFSRQDVMSTVPLDEALTELFRTDPSFMEEVRKRLIPVKDRFFSPPHRDSPEKTNLNRMELAELLRSGSDHG